MKTSYSFDQAVESVVRGIAGRTSRRCFLGTIARMFGIGAVLPLLPVDRTGRNDAFAQAAPTDDPTECTYWRYCAIDGYLCNCCGGGPATCPPGTSPSPTAWIGSCINPADGGNYLIAYRDCCGKGSCGRCECLRTEGELPVYRPQRNGDIIWCFGAENMVYHCTGAALVGKA